MDFDTHFQAAEGKLLGGGKKSPGIFIANRGYGKIG
ncbi:MAG: hypothetical protein UZ16_OP3001003527 [Candidatus Hinthialibacteria bacterium OLB16]|nr:MAG: hypothetical protein UZ16_OP3001003527 [Candidatus Hinthialibacteria bacterium OLB16]